MGERRNFRVTPEFARWAHEIGLTDPRRCGEGRNKLPLWEADLVRKEFDCRFEFGDLGYSRGGRHLVVEWETASGVANWAKYLAYVAETPGVEVRLLHVHQRTDALSTSESWYLSHRKLQAWLATQLQALTGSRFAGRSLRWPDERADAEQLFREWGAWLLHGAPVTSKGAQ